MKTDTSREIWIQVSELWRAKLMERHLSREAADDVVSRVRPLFALLRVGQTFLVDPSKEKAFRACWPSQQGQFDQIVRDELAERLEAEVAAMMLREAGADLETDAAATPARAH